jgi:drug/metabolite transporter (DMT)-like permease
VLLIWVLIAFVETAGVGGVALINKRLTTCLDPVAANMLVRGVSVTTILVVTTPLTVLHLWDLTYDITWEAAGYVALIAVVGWLVAQSAYYYALRSGRVSVVIPITSTNLLFTALFASILIGAVLGKLTLAGLVIAATGIVFIARVYRRDTVVAEGLDEQPVLLPSSTSTAEPPRWARSVPFVILLALASAAGWGLGPVLIQLAQESLGGTTVTMILIAQGLAFALLAGFVVIRRTPLTTRVLTRAERRRMRRLVVITGMLEGTFAILWSALFLRERLSRRLAFAVALTLFGVFLATADRLR